MQARQQAQPITHSRQQKFRLIQFSFLMLFVELALIRFTNSSFMFLSFFSNYILMASFLGIAVGFLRANKRFPLFELSPIFLAVIFYLCHRYRFEYQINLNSGTDDLDYFVSLFKDNALPVSLTLPLSFFGVTMVMAALANGTARAFRQFTPLLAYRLEILGSLSGVVAFTLLSFAHASPLYWGGVICALFLSIQFTTWRKQPLWVLVQVPALCIMMLVLVQESSTATRIWSPYYKIAVLPYSHGRYAIDVNGSPQQFVESVAQRHIYKPFYFLPYTHLAPNHALDNVLVIGAGTGGDVAIALAQGAKHVDAVEIDPALLQLGKQLNPDAVYQDPRVTTFIDDGRAFMQQNRQQYDAVIIALADSMTIISRQASIRLENYLLTREGIAAARDHLKPNGMFAMYNYYRTPWIVDRLGNTLATVFGQTPCLDSAGESNHWLSVLTVSPTANNLQCSTLWKPHSADVPQPATDNRPFFYMEYNDISNMYLFCILFIFISSVCSIKLAGGSIRAMKSYIDLFFMGAAFLLLETKNIINFALFFGTTWLVNSLVFIGILTTVYLSIIVTERSKQLSTVLLFGLLLSSLCLCWLIPNEYILQLPVLPRLVAAIALAFSPVFFANLIFAARFKSTAQSTNAFAANMCGAVAGGLLEYSSLALGYQNLLILIAIIYALAVLTMVYSPNKERLGFVH